MIQFGTSAGVAPRRRCPSGASANVAEGRLRTLGSPLTALLLQAQGGVPPESAGTSILNLITRSYLTLGVLSVLGLISIVSWGIIFYKLWIFRRSRAQTAQFLDVFRRSNKFSEVQAV